MNFDDKLERVKELIAKRDEIEAELAILLGIEPKKRRGRRKRQEDEAREPEPEYLTA